MLHFLVVMTTLVGLSSVANSQPSNISESCAVAPSATHCRTLGDRLLDVLNVLDRQVPADAGVQDNLAIQAAIDAAASRGGGIVYLPARTACYVLAAPITATAVSSGYAPIIIRGGGSGTCVQPGTSMTSMLTLPGRQARVEAVSFDNVGSRAINAIEMTCPVQNNNTNNFTIIDQNYFVGFTNGVKNTNCDAFRVQTNWFQNQTGWDVLSADNGTNSRVERNYSLGSAGNVLYDKVNYAVEGVYIEGNHFLPTAGKGVVLRACLSCFIRGNQIDQTNDTAITLDGTGANKPIADVGLSDNWLGPRSGATNAAIGLSIGGNVVEVRVTNMTVNGWSKCGIRMAGGLSGSVQNVSISGLRAINNGRGEGTGDICVNSDPLGVGPFTVRDSWLMSSGLGQRSAVEYEGALGFWTNNRLAVAPTKSGKSIWRSNFGDDRDVSNGKYVGWSPYAPALSCAGGALGSGVTATAAFDREQNRVSMRVRLQIPNATARGTCSGPIFVGLPAAVASNGVATFAGRENGVNGRMLQAYSGGGGSSMAVYDYAQNSVALVGADLWLTGTYEAAP